MIKKLFFLKILCCYILVLLSIKVNAQIKCPPELYANWDKNTPAKTIESSIRKAQRKYHKDYLTLSHMYFTKAYLIKQQSGLTDTNLFDKAIECMKRASIGCDKSEKGNLINRIGLYYYYRGDIQNAVVWFAKSVRCRLGEDCNGWWYLKVLLLSKSNEQFDAFLSRYCNSKSLVPEEVRKALALELQVENYR